MLPVAIISSYLLKSQDRISLIWALTAAIYLLGDLKSHIFKKPSVATEANKVCCAGCHIVLKIYPKWALGKLETRAYFWISHSLITVSAPEERNKFYVKCEHSIDYISP